MILHRIETSYCFFIDNSVPSKKKRNFVYFPSSVGNMVVVFGVFCKKKLEKLAIGHANSIR